MIDKGTRPDLESLVTVTACARPARLGGRVKLWQAGRKWTSPCKKRLSGRPRYARWPCPGPPKGIIL